MHYEMLSDQAALIRSPKIIWGYCPVPPSVYGPAMARRSVNCTTQKLTNDWREERLRCFYGVGYRHRHGRVG